LELLNAYASTFIGTTTAFSELRAELEGVGAKKDLTDEQYETLLRELVYARGWCGELKMTSSFNFLHLIEQEARNDRHALKAGEVFHRLDSAMIVLKHELVDRFFYYVPGSSRPSLCFVPRDNWGTAPDKFPSAAADIDEASYCLALGRPTAAVFHLMRVLQVALGSLARAVASPITNPQDQNWLRVIESIEAEIKRMQPGLASGTPASAEDRRFYASAALQFTYFKDAFRNYVTHTSFMYNDGSAESIYNHVRDFMDLLATRLAE
jgi:hypothetical protein